MDPLLLPDFFAMATLLGVLATVRRRYPQHDVRLWMGGLLLIVLECAARVVYGVRLPTVWHRLSHIVALDAYLLAGVLFVRSALEELRRMPKAPLYVILNAAPGVALLTYYGAGLKVDHVYVGLAIAGATMGLLTSALLHRSRLHLLALLCVWIPVTVASLAHAPRMAAYLLLGLVYLLAAFTFVWSLPRGSSGKIAVVAGFSVWSVCFITHPWIAESHPQWQALASEVWNMQKFIITVGLLLVLFEKQVTGNEWLALHDQLTGLPNRRLFEDRIGNAIARAERDRTALILLTMDVNNFKDVNDNFGHDAGDALLRSVSASLQHVVRRTDTLARLGGDEFVLLATDVKAARAPKRERRWLRSRDNDAEETADDIPVLAEAAQTLHGTEHPVLRHATRIESDIRSAIDKPVILPGHNGPVTVDVTVSIGVSVYPTDSTDLVELTRIADRRMYEDKRRQKAERGGLGRVLSMLTTN